MRYRLGMILSILAAVFLDTVIFARFNVSGIAPDCVLAVVVSVGILKGSDEAGITGFLVGMLMDIMFSRIIGINAMAYMLSGAIGGFFYKKYYADNFVIPLLTVAFCGFLKENFMALVTLIAGGSFSYLEMLIAYILPVTLVSSATSLLIHHLLKPGLARSGKKRYDRAAGGAR